MNKTLEIIIKEFAETERDKIEWHKMFQKAEQGTETKEIAHRAWRDACEKHWLLWEILEESGFTRDQLYNMEYEALS